MGRFALVRALVVCLCVICAPSARAQPVPSPLRLEASPILGPTVPVFEGWLSVAVRLRNTSAQAIEGTVELSSDLPWSKNRIKNVTRAPFSAPAKSAVVLELPTHGFAEGQSSLKVRALDASDHELATLELPDVRGADPFLFDLTTTSRLVPMLRGAPVAVTIAPERFRGAYESPQLAVGSPQLNPKSGAPILPTRAAGYASASVVVARSQDLVALAATELDALSSWVLGGGALALVVSRPEDLRHPALSALTGGAIRATTAPSELQRPALFLIPPDPSKAPEPSSPGYPSSNGLTQKRLAPESDVARELVGYDGGNLHPSLWGAAASYGLGEVHLLAFDVTREPFVSSDWVKRKLLDLVRHATERQVTIALPHAQTALDTPQMNAIRRELDPNENTRWSIVAAALVLLVYAVLAGPVNFYLAARRGRPLRALLHLPLWATGALLLVVVLGVLGKGVEGRVRRLSLVEAGAGMARAAATRFRGIYASSSSELTVRATDPSSVLDVAGDSDDVRHVLTLDRDLTRLSRLRSKPWQTIVVREDGFIALGGGISVVDQNGDLAIKNRTARDLLAVVVKPPRRDAVYFPRIADGELVLASRGKALPSGLGRSTIGPGAASHSLDTGLFATTVDESAPGAGSAWQAFEALRIVPVDWWPEDVPVVLGQLDGGEGRLSDSGLRVDRDRVLVRVVGYGGVP